MKILIIDDETQIQKFLRISLVSQGYDVIMAETGQQGLSQAILAEPDLVILDLGLPDMDGKQVLQKLLNEKSVPVIVLSVRSSEEEKVATLDMGAMDYVVKPFSVNELLARIRRVLNTEPARAKSSLYFDDGNLCIDQEQHRVYLRESPVSLTRKEWAVLMMLVQAAGRLVTQASLLQKIWGESHTGDSQYLRNVILKLRYKLQDDAANPRYLETEPGIGYRFVPNQTHD